MPDLVHLFGGRPGRREEEGLAASPAAEETPARAVGGDAGPPDTGGAGPNHGRVRRRRNGQSLVEFALVIPLLLAMVGAIVQFGMVFWAQNTLTQVVRDTGRWAATQQFPCTAASTTQVNTEANLVATNSSLFGYSSTTPWTTTYEADDSAIASFASEGVAVTWVADHETTPTEGCPPKDNQAVYHVTIKINHTVPTFFPGMQYLPGLGTCTSSGCQIVLSSTAQFRMEPAP